MPADWNEPDKLNKEWAEREPGNAPTCVCPSTHGYTFVPCRNVATWEAIDTGKGFCQQHKDMAEAFARNLKWPIPQFRIRGEHAQKP